MQKMYSKIKMKVVINALQYKQNSSGIGVMIRELFGAYVQLMPRHCQVVLSRDAPDFPAGPGTEVIRAPWSYGQKLRRIFFQTFQLGRKYCKNAILLTTDSKVPLFLPKDCFVIPIITDLAVYRLRETYQLSRALWWRLQYRYIRRRVNLFLAISEFTKQEMVDILHIPPEKIMVVPCACSLAMRPVTDEGLLEKVREKYQLPEHFVLFVGNFNPRKNLKRLMEAFDLAKDQENIPHYLVIAGEQGWKFDQQEALKNIHHIDDIHFIGYVPDGDMPTLYSAADLFAFPTLYEGFGIPVIEAQACGTPVLTSDCSALPEICGDGAVFVNPYDARDVCCGMLRVLQDSELSKTMAEKGLQNARKFSWKDSAQKLNELIESVVKF